MMVWLVYFVVSGILTWFGYAYLFIYDLDLHSLASYYFEDEGWIAIPIKKKRWFLKNYGHRTYYEFRDAYVVQMRRQEYFDCHYPKNDIYIGNCCFIFAFLLSTGFVFSNLNEDWWERINLLLGVPFFVILYLANNFRSNLLKHHFEDFCRNIDEKSEKEVDREAHPLYSRLDKKMKYQRYN